MIKRFKILICLLPFTIIAPIVAFCVSDVIIKIILMLLVVGYYLYLIATVAEIYAANALNIDDIADDLKAIRKLLEEKKENQGKV